MIMKDVELNPLGLPPDREHTRRRTLSDGQLWSYALGLLSPKEEAAVIKALARNQADREDLKQMRQALGICTDDVQPEQVTAPATLLSAAQDPQTKALADQARTLVHTLKEGARRLMGELSLNPVEVAFVLARLKGGFVTAWISPQCTQAVTAMGNQGEDDTAQPLETMVPVAQPLAGITLSDATRVDLVDIPGRGVNISLKFSRPIPEGKVTVCIRSDLPETAWQLVPGKSAYLQQGRVVLKDCPDGILRLELPDKTSLILGALPDLDKTKPPST
jgi:hypothetical protein